MYTAKLRADKMAALKTKDTVKNKVITMLLSGITYKQKELGRELTEQECLDVISKELKQEKEALEMSQGREDKVAELQAEIAILESYLPKQMSADEVAAKVAELIAGAGLEPIVKNKGMIMKTVMAELKGKADGKVIGAAVDALLK
ncbi:MAG: GatB/YqeY domain-containing protein [Peptococcaceae bacterium]|nr:GatB/YqeY domain-containing protein [Peptococcaceae bacterium]